MFGLAWRVCVCVCVCVCVWGGGKSSKILEFQSGISKGNFKIPNKISYPHIKWYIFYSNLKIKELLDLRAHKCFWNAHPWCHVTGDSRVGSIQGAIAMLTINRIVVFSVLNLRGINVPLSFMGLDFGCLYYLNIDKMIKVQIKFSNFP